ncbi:MAG: phosphoglucomutase/phosphomannomutase family protein [Chloroflexi bacterium]|nr:phosphoglucomutase/phosphomannomutase family protein [Chloroflexota bacterium]
MAIKFGTDGWRGIIADDFTFENVRFCAQGVAQYLLGTGQAPRGLVVGYDTRFASEDFAAAVAEVMAGNGIKTILCDRSAPTPVVSYNIITRAAAGAAIITASHNPARWNGFKFKPEYAGSASPEVITALEDQIGRVEASRRVMLLPMSQALHQGLVQHVEPKSAYLRHIGSLVDLEALKTAGLRIGLDAMYGAGAGYFPSLLNGGSTQVQEIHGERNPLFPGMAQPEPVAHNLKGLTDLITERSLDVGLALDGDADRAGAVDEKGQFITPLQMFALLALYLLEVRGFRGPLVKSLTATSMIYRLGELYQVPVHETPVGFKYIGPIMLQEKAIIGGEESGGFGCGCHIPERDGILSNLFFIDLMVRTGKRPSELVQYLYEKTGQHHYQREDLIFPQGQREAVQKRVTQARPDALAGLPVLERDTIDGVRFRLRGGAWLVVRFSGTEPLLRIYAEAESPQRARELINAGRDIAGL